jgi:hypothetical protein
MRTRNCDRATTLGRLGKAEQFLEQAEVLIAQASDPADAADAYVTLCVHAGIAAADAICCNALGLHARGESHHEAVQLLKSVRPGGTELGGALEILLGFKSRVGYSSEPVSAEIRKRSGRQATKLVSAARERVTRA